MAQIPPWPLPATVVSQDPDNYALNVVLDGPTGGQMPSLPVKVMTLGPRDAVLGQYPELPRRGTRGLVVFPRGDLRSGHWIGATDPALIDASTLQPGVGNVAYASHFGGGVSWRGEDGTVWEQFPDGTTMQAGPTTPAPTRHTLGTDRTRTRTPFPLSERVGQAPGAFALALRHPTGATAVLDVSGGWTLTSGSGSGGTIHLNPDGSAVVVPGGAGFMAVSGDLRVTGAITAGYGGGDQVGVQTHTHQQGTDSHGDTEVPTNAPTAGT